MTTFELSSIRLTRMPSHPQPRDKLCKSAGMMFRISERFVYKPRLNAGSAWQLYGGVTIPNKEDLILVGNPNKRTSKLVYVLADRAEYRILDISEIPFVTLATTRTIISARTPVRFRQPFQFTFGTQGTAAMAAPQSLIHAQTPPATFSLPVTTVASPQPRHRSEPQPEVASPVAACITSIASYLTSQEDRTAQKRSRENALEEDQAMDPNRCQRRRVGGPDYCQWVYGRVQALLAM